MIRSASVLLLVIGGTAALGSTQGDRAVAAEPAGKIAFVSRAAPGIWLINADGSKSVRLTKGKLDLGPTWSPDGRRLAYFSVNEKDESAHERIGDLWYHSELYLIDAAGVERRRLSEVPACWEGIVWSPKGDRIAFRSAYQDKGKRLNLSVYVLDLQGRNLRRLSKGRGSAGGTAWSADGKRLAYTRDGKVHVVQVETGKTTSFEPRIRPRGKTMWTPDGERLLYEPKERNQHGFCLVEPDGAGLLELPRHSSHDRLWHCTPHGEIVFSAGDRILVRGLDGGSAREIASVETKLAALRDGDTALAPDGKWLAFVSADDVHVVPLSGGESVRLTTGRKASQLAWWMRKAKSK